MGIATEMGWTPQARRENDQKQREWDRQNAGEDMEGQAAKSAASAYPMPDYIAKNAAALTANAQAPQAAPAAPAGGLQTAPAPAAQTQDAPPVVPDLSNDHDHRSAHTMDTPSIKLTLGDQLHQTSEAYKVNWQRNQHIAQTLMDQGRPDLASKYTKAANDSMEQFNGARSNAIAATHDEVANVVTNAAAAYKSGQIDAVTAVRLISAANSKLPNGLDIQPFQKKDGSWYVTYNQDDKHQSGEIPIDDAHAQALIDQSMKYTASHLGQAVQKAADAHDENSARTGLQSAQAAEAKQRGNYYDRMPNANSSASFRLKSQEQKPIGFDPNGRAVYNVDGQQVAQNESGDMEPYAGPLANSGSGKGLTPPPAMKGVQGSPGLVTDGKNTYEVVPGKPEDNSHWSWGPNSNKNHPATQTMLRNVDTGETSPMPAQGGMAGPGAGARKPDMQTWMNAAKAKNPKASEADLKAYYTKKYGA